MNKREVTRNKIKKIVLGRYTSEFPECLTEEQRQYLTSVPGKWFFSSNSQGRVQYIFTYEELWKEKSDTYRRFRPHADLWYLTRRIEASFDELSSVA